MTTLGFQSTAQPTPSRNLLASTPNRASLVDELPTYKKPLHPLNRAAQDKLKQIHDRRTHAMLQEYHKKAEQQITDAAAMINDRVREKELYCATRRKKWERGSRVEEQVDEERKLEELKSRAKELTERLEAGIRSVIDGEASALRTGESLEWLREHAPRQLEAEYQTQRDRIESQSQSQSRQRRQRRDEEGNEEMGEEEDERPSPGPTPLDGSHFALTGPWELFQDRQQKKRDEYTSISHETRYAKNNSYIGFKQIVHDARYGDSGPQLPRPETWFTEHGSPAPGITATQNEDDDDIVVDKATISTKCPLTLQKFKDPVTSRKCPHTFEKTAIYEMIRHSASRLGSGGIRGQGVKCVDCPVAGCEQVCLYSSSPCTYPPFPPITKYQYTILTCRL